MAAVGKQNNTNQQTSKLTTNKQPHAIICCEYNGIPSLPTSELVLSGSVVLQWREVELPVCCHVSTCRVFSEGQHHTGGILSDRASS